MRFMSIPPFGHPIEIPDFDFFVRSRLNQAIVVWPEQAIALVGYMGWPNDPEAREASKSSLRAWSEGSQVVRPGDTNSEIGTTLSRPRAAGTGRSGVHLAHIRSIEEAEIRADTTREVE